MEYNELIRSKVALSTRWLAKRWTLEDASAEAGENTSFQLIVCTGERMSGMVSKLYKGVGIEVTSFLPQHSKGLGNEFRCFANFDCTEWTREIAFP